MDLIVLVMVISIYVGAIAAPLSLFILARRTEQGPIWQGLVGLCTALVWLALMLGFLREFFDLSVPRDVLEIAGAAGMVSFAMLAIMGLVMVTRAWPAKVARNRAVRSTRLGPLVAADIE